MNARNLFIATVLVSLGAAAFASEHDSVDHPPIPASSVSRAQVQAELQQALRDGTANPQSEYAAYNTVVPAAPQPVVVTQQATQTPVQTQRALVRAERIAQGKVLARERSATVTSYSLEAQDRFGG